MSTEAAAATERASTETSPLRAMIDEVYLLALRMLWHPKDASDAADRAVREIMQELPTFPREGAPRIAALRIATRSLLATAESPMERQKWTFEAIARDLARGLDEPLPLSVLVASRHLLLEEVKVGCTQIMLLSLDREHRIAYVLGDIFDIDSDRAAEILEVDSATFGKRLLRARDRLLMFMQDHCGLVNPACACHCSRRIGRALLTGRVSQGNLLFAAASPTHDHGDAFDESDPDDQSRGHPARVFGDQRLRPAPDVLVARLSVFAGPQRRPRNLRT